MKIETQRDAVKQRLNEAAARLLAGDRKAADDADVAMADMKQLTQASKAPGADNAISNGMENQS